jgi:hypothetical protein
MLWWNMFHEGATFLCALQNGLVPPRTGLVKRIPNLFVFYRVGRSNHMFYLFCDSFSSVFL